MSSTTHIASKLEQSNNQLFNVQKPSVYGNLSRDQEHLSVNPLSAFNMWENATENSSEHENIIDESHLGRPISVANKTLENKVGTIDRAIKKWDYPILCTKWMWHMALFRISLQKKYIEKYALTGYLIHWLRNNVLRVSQLAKRISLAFKKRGNVYLYYTLTGG